MYIFKNKCFGDISAAVTIAATGLTLLLGAPNRAAAEPGAVLDEVVVTAQRREQRLLEVPVSVTAFSGEYLERNNVRGASDYLSRTPNVSFTEDGQSGSRGLGLSIRGVNNLVSGENAFVNSVGIYLDEFSVASVPNQVANPFLPDMDRVEVLRGPQGTYFGRNSLGGALNLTTADPGNAFEGRLKVGGQGYRDAGDLYNVTGVLNLPVSPTLGARAVVFYEDSTGAVENINPGGTDDSGHDWLMARVKAVWQPTDSTTVRFTAIHSDEDQGHDENVPSGVLDLDTVDSLGIGAAIDPGTGFWPDNRNRLSHDLDERNEIRSDVFIVSASTALNRHWTLEGIAGIIDASQDRLFDNDLIGGLDALSRTNRYDGKSYSGELRLTYGGDRIDWTSGVLVARDDQEQFNNVAISSDPTGSINGISFLPPFPQGLGLALNYKDFEVDSAAFFTDLTLRISDTLELLAGGRYTHDRVTNRIASFGIRPGPDAPNPATDPVGFYGSFINAPRPVSEGTGSFDDFSPRIGLRYQPSDQWSFYTTISRGYKAGGNSVGNNTNEDGQPAFAVPYDEETLWNYEIGVKAELLDQRLRVSAAAFRLDWDDLQLEAFRFLTPGDLSSNFEQTINAESARATGAELEFVAAPTANLTVGGALGVLDTEITSDTQAEITGGYVVDLEGRPLPKAPELTWNLFTEYRWPTAAREYWARIDFIHRDGQYSDVEGLTVLQTTGPSPNSGRVRELPYGEFPFRSPDYDLVNLRLGMDTDNYSLGLYVENLTDEEYYTGTQENFGASGIRLKPHPRVIGASAEFRF
ncbi:MAG: TonB-dependent receptor [Pseudomonadota bacterium]